MGGTDDSLLRVLFGKAFLIQVERGDMEAANLFARAFLLRTSNADAREPVTTARDERGVD